MQTQKEMSKSNKTEVLRFRLDRNLREDIFNHCETLGISVSEYVRGEIVKSLK